MVLQHTGERNFHAFYQLLVGASDKLLSTLHLKRDHKSYAYINQGAAHPVHSINDKQDYQAVAAALTGLGLSADRTETIWRIVASILHLVRDSLVLTCKLITRLSTQFIDYANHWLWDWSIDWWNVIAGRLMDGWIDLFMNSTWVSRAQMMKAYILLGQHNVHAKWRSSSSGQRGPAGIGGQNVARFGEGPEACFHIADCGGAWRSDGQVSYTEWIGLRSRRIC